MERNVNVAEPVVGDEEKGEVLDVMDSGYFLQGPRVREFEEKWSEYVGVDHAVAVANGTVAIQMSLNALGIEPGDEVIVPSLTFGSTATAVVHQAGVPVFADIQRDIYNLDPADLERCVTPETEVVMPVHLYGHPAEMDEINEFAEKHDLDVIEDAAQAHGASYKGEKVGSIGDVGTFSFYATKNITTGEGGIVTTDNDEVAEKVRKLRSHGMENRDQHVMLGYNYRMSEISGGIGMHQVDKLDELNRRRREISERLFTELDDLEWLQPSEVREYVDHAYFWAPSEVQTDVVGMSGKKVWRKLKDEGVETRHRYVEPLYEQPVFENHMGFNSDFPWSQNPNDRNYDLQLENVEEVAGEMIGLPNHPKLTEGEIEYVIETVRNFHDG